MKGRLKLTFIAVLLFLVPSPIWPQGRTRKQGEGYVGLTYATISGLEYYGPDYKQIPLGSRYTQEALEFYAEIGVVDRWLTITASGEAFRWNELASQGQTRGVGDTRLGFWSGWMVTPIALTVGFWIGLPTGDSLPDPRPGSDAEARLIAASLPTGDGELDFEPSLRAGSSFGGQDWPFQHYWKGTLGYWIRTRGIKNGVDYAAEFGTTVPDCFLDRFWLIGKLNGLQSSANAEEAGRGGPTGFGQGVSYTAFAVALYARLVDGFGLSAETATAIRARSVINASPLRLTLSYAF